MDLEPATRAVWSRPSHGARLRRFSRLRQMSAHANPQPPMLILAVDAGSKHISAGLSPFAAVELFVVEIGSHGCPYKPTVFDDE